MTKDICNNCKHYFGDLRCSAFPKKIPNVILTGNNDHSKPLKNQKNEIVFEPLDDK